MFGLDLHGWEAVMLLSLAVAALAALAIVITTRVVILLQREALRESVEAFEKYKSDADLKIAQAVEGSAKANERAAESELRLEKLRQEIGPRNLRYDLFLETLRGKPKPASVKIMYLSDDPDAFQLSQQLSTVLKTADWVFESPVPIPAHDIGPLSKLPVIVAKGGIPSGVTIVARVLVNPPADELTSYGVLAAAFRLSLGRIRTSSDAELADGVLRVVIGPKP